MKSKVHISLDDTKGIFKYLAAYSYVTSIFETRTLGFLQELHRTYGTKFTLLCMYSSKGFTLQEVSENWREEFRDNRDWLNFGFHSLDEDTNYQGVSADKIKEDYCKTIKELSRITGATQFANTIRLHGFSGSRAACVELKKMGIECLLTADDERYSYYLSKEECQKVNSSGMYREESTGLKFCRSLTRLELCDNPVEELEKGQAANWELLSVFTHEWLLDREDVREKLRSCCAWEQQNT